MKLGVILSTNDPETCWNALRFANFSLKQKDQVRVFMNGKGVEFQKISTAKFDSVGQADAFLKGGGKIDACGTCMKSREQAESEMCPLSTLKDLYVIVRESEKVVTF